MSAIASIERKGKRISRVVLETSLKPFMKIDPETIDAVCEEIFRQWYPLLVVAEECSILLWVADGSEILTYSGQDNAPMEWARYIGFCNGEFKIYHHMDETHPKAAKLYIKDPPRMKFADLRRIVSAFRRVGTEKFRLKVSIGETFDPGPEFAHSDFKYRDHSEIIGGGRESLIGPSFPMVNAWARLNGDSDTYAGYPRGIEEGTSFGSFLGRQCRHFLTDMGFDYLWLSNGFGFSHFAWSYLGVNFDGNTFGHESYKDYEPEIMTFWNDFKSECPDFPVEVRGTNFSMGMDLAGDLTPYEKIYNGDFIRLPPPNSPWGPLNKDYGLEMVGYISRIASLPADDYLFRFYPNDPWFWQNPWWDWYDREAFDIYCPLSASRITPDGVVQNPGVVQFLTIDTEEGVLDERCALEVIPHIRRGIDDFPDEPGLITWLYPFHGYHRIAESCPDRMNEVFFGDWFMRSSVNHGFPLNTILEADDLSSVLSSNRQSLENSILVTPTTIVEGSYENVLMNHVHTGGKVLIYGPLSKTPEVIRKELDIDIVDGVDGHVTLESDLMFDPAQRAQETFEFVHDSVASGGPLCEICVPASPSTRVLATVSPSQRSYAVERRDPEWNGGAIVWVRGSNPFTTRRGPNEPSRIPKAIDNSTFDPSVLSRLLLQTLGYTFLQHLREGTTQAPLMFLSRSLNGWFLTGYAPNGDAYLELQFPEGAPLPVGSEVELVNGHTLFHPAKTYHEECRLFVSDQDDGVISCSEVSRFRIGFERCIEVTGLESATILAYPPAEFSKRAFAEIDGTIIEGTKLPGDCPALRFENITGHIKITW